MQLSDRAPDLKTGLKSGDLPRKPTCHEGRDTGEIDPPPPPGGGGIKKKCFEKPFL